jgi:pilus assembly protein CpaE
MILLIDPVSELIGRLRLARPDQEVLHVSSLGEGQRALEDQRIDAAVIGPSFQQDESLELARKLHEQYPSVSVVLASMVDSSTLYREAMRAGVTDVLPYRAEDAEIRDVLDRATAETLRSRQYEETEEGPSLGRTIATFATKGGCGKSFIATNLATMLAERYPGEVVLVDLDLQAGDASLMLQLVPELSLTDAAEYGEGLDDEALRSLLTPAGDLQVLAAPSHPVHAEEVTPETVVRVVELLRTMFRWIVIDGPPSFTEQMLAAIDLLDTVVVVSSLDVPSIKNLKLSVETLKDLGVPRERMKIVLNRADSKVGLGVREVERSLGTTIDIQLPSSREVPFAVNQGVPIVTVRPKAPISKALRDALQQFDRVPESSSGQRRGRGTRSKKHD